MGRYKLDDVAQFLHKPPKRSSNPACLAPRHQNPTIIAPPPQPATPPAMSIVSISAVYRSPLPAPSDTNSFAVTTAVAPATEASPQSAQTTHVAAVRKALTQLQDELVSEGAGSGER